MLDKRRVGFLVAITTAIMFLMENGEIRLRDR